MSFPTALDTGSSLPTPNTTDKTNSPSHSALHGATNIAVIATETKLGTGASTPTANTLMFGTGSGTSAWTQLTSSQLASTLTDETGTGSAVFATTPTLVTPKVDTINESTPANGVTVGGVNLSAGVVTTANSVGTTALASSAVTSAKIASSTVASSNINFGGAGAGVWWEEIGRTTLGVAGDTISVTSIPARTYLMIIKNVFATGALTATMRFNNDSGANYAWRKSANGGADTSTASDTSIVMDTGTAQALPGWFYVLNLTAQEKIMYGSYVAGNTAGAANLPGRNELGAKWANTSVQINRVDLLNGGAGDFAIGSELIILGHN